MHPRLPMVLMAAILGFALLLAGCTDHGAGSQPPASTRTLAPTPVKPTTVRTLAVPTAAATSPESTATPRPGTVGQGGSPLQVTGPVLGFRGTGGSYLDLITFRVVKGPSADPVDMEHVQITLTRHDETTGLRYEIREQKNGDQDGILENGEMFTIAVPVMPSYWIYRNEPFELRVLVPGSASIQIRSRGPDVMEEQNLLAEA